MIKKNRNVKPFGQQLAFRKLKWNACSYKLRGAVVLVRVVAVVKTVKKSND